MNALVVFLVGLAVVALIGLTLSVKVVTQYQKGVLFRLGKVVGVKEPGLALIIPVIDRLVRVSLRIVTMPIQSQGIITRDNVSVDISAVAYFRVVDAVKSVIAIENVDAAINQIAQTTLRKVVGQHTLDEALSETDVINASIQKILDVATLEWGVEVHLVELKDIQLPESMKRAMARQAEAEREKRAKIIAAEGESMAAAALGEASDTMMAHPLALQLRNLQTLAELGVEKNTTVVFPAPMMSAIGEIGNFLARETAAIQGHHTPSGRGQTIGTTGASDNQRGAGERRGCGTGARGRLTAPGKNGCADQGNATAVGQRRSRRARARNAVRSPIIGLPDPVADVAAVPNFRSEAVSGASSHVAARNQSGSASLWMVRSVKRYWCTSEPRGVRQVVLVAQRPNAHGDLRRSGCSAGRGTGGARSGNTSCRSRTPAADRP